MLKQKAKLRTFRTLTITLLMVLSVLLTTIFSIYNTKVYALDNTGLAGAYYAGGGNKDTAKDLYENGSFNGDVLRDIREKLFGNATATQTEMVEYVTNNRSKKEDITGSYIVNAPTINNSVATNAKNTAYESTGMVIRLGGIDWMVVSMTLAGVADEGTEQEDSSKKDDVILTLYQVDSTKASKFSDEYNKSVNNKYGAQGDSMYASSRLRKNITEVFTEYEMFRNNSEFAKKYLVQPQYVTYQGKETQRFREGWMGSKTSATGLTFPSDGKGCHLPNDSYNARNDGGDSNQGGWAKFTTTGFTGYKDSAFAYPGYGTNAAYKGNPQRYDAWKNDYIWIPSATETGWNGTDTFLNGTASIWELSDAQRAHTLPSAGNGYSWLRSGHFNHYDVACAVAADGTSNGNVVSSTYGVRPAIHFNLSAAGTYVANPGDLENTYNGNDQDLEAFVANPDKKPDWYNAEYYGENKVELTYYKEEGSALKQLTDNENPKDAGTYWVKAQINSAWLDKYGNAPKFAGEPDNTKLPPGVGGAEQESDTLRWFKITIKKAKLTLKLELNLNQTLTGGGVRLLFR